ncbi:MAG: alpha/beta hydrolase [Spirochaetales bacterium]|nr:alpha/beta hydrolase [Spirochaetales bacterium]
MINDVFRLGDAELKVYVLENPDDDYGDKKRPFVIICPGGGYNFLASREGECIATMFNFHGINAGVLYYSLNPNRFPKALCELSQAVAVVRSHSAQWHTPYDQIAVCGFSAGGHLAASLATMWHEAWLDDESGTTKDQRQPNALISCYSVITSGDFANKGTFESLLGPDPDNRLLEMNSVERNVTEHTPPTFIWQTWTDKLVPVENALLFAEALRRSGVGCEMHIYGDGEHGLGLATSDYVCQKHPVPNPHVARWSEDAVEWLNHIFGRD